MNLAQHAINAPFNCWKGTRLALRLAGIMKLLFKKKESVVKAIELVSPVDGVRCFRITMCPAKTLINGFRLTNWEQKWTAVATLLQICSITVQFVCRFSQKKCVKSAPILTKIGLSVLHFAVA